MERMGLGLIGCGGIARSAHLPAMAQLVDHVVLRATADADPAAAQAAAAPWGAEHFSDYRRVLDRSDISAVVIARPNICTRNRWKPRPPPASTCCAKNRWRARWPKPTA
jgi:predicted dehydrogenase